MKYNLFKNKIATFGMIACIALSMVACTGTGIGETDLDETPTNSDIENSAEESTDPSEQNEEANPNTEDVSGDPVKSIEIEALEALVANDGRAADVVNFLEAHIGDVSSADADVMLDILLKMQTGLIQASHEGLLYEDAYMDALNNTMGGVIDPEKVGDIEDETVRAYYQSVIDSYLTMVRYEETPVVVTDWSKIKGLNAQYSEGLQMAVDYSEYRELLRAEEVGVLVDRIFDMEAKILTLDTSFAKERLIATYDEYLSFMLSGPEGSYIYRLRDSEDSYTAKMKAAIENHLESGFAQTANVLINDTEMDEMSRFQFLSAYRNNNAYIEYKWSEVTKDENGYPETRLVFMGEDSEIENKVNTIIQNAKDYLVKDLDQDKITAISMYRAYDITSDATITIFANYTDDQGITQNKMQTVNIDLMTGSLMSLEGLLGQVGDELLATIESLTGVTFTTVPDFNLISTGIMMTASENDINTNAYAVITKDQLLKIQLGN